MLVKTGTITIRGIEPLRVDVEVSIYNRGLPGFEIVGLPNKSVEESKLRIRSAFNNLGIEFPTKKIIVNLAPADIKKELILRLLYPDDQKPSGFSIAAIISGNHPSPKSAFEGKVFLHDRENFSDI